MTVTRKRRLLVALLLGVLLAGAGVSAGGAPVMASPGTSRPDVRAEVLALFGHHGMDTRRPGAPGAPAAVRGLPSAIPAPGTRSNLSGVFCTSTTNCLAVGSFDSASSGPR